MTRAFVAAITIALSLSPVLASEGEQQLSFTGDYVYASQHAGGAAVEYSYHLSDLWRLGVEAGWIGGDPNESRPCFALQGGIQLDAIIWVPYIQLVSSVHLGKGPQSDLGSALLLGVEVGADYRPNRKLSVGMGAGYHHVLSTYNVANMPSLFTTSIRFSTYF